MNVLFLCRKSDLILSQASLVRALENRAVRITYVADSTHLAEGIRQLVERCEERPSLILQPELDFPLLPRGLTEIDIPTACLQIDTYAYTRRRISWSMLFDYPIVFHPGFRAHFESVGHQGVITFYHAACRYLFDRPPVERIFDVGSVGHTSAKIQGTRRRILRALAGKFRMNQWDRLYSFEEMAEVYRHSKIVVNVPRDDYPQDANMRAFEAMAAGCLLINPASTELTAIGFQEDVHFVSYRDEAEIVNLVARYLSDGAERERIASAGKAKVLKEHTYDCRAEHLLRTLEQNKGKLFAPARQWPRECISLHYLDYYAAHGLLDCAYLELRQLLKSSFPKALAGGMLISRGWLAALRRGII